MSDEEKNQEEKSPKQKMVKIKVKKADDFKRIYAIGALGGHTPWDFRIGFYNDVPRMEEVAPGSPPTMDREVLVEAMLSPTAAKELLLWLGSHVQQFEKQFGPIKLRRMPIKDGNKIPNQAGSYSTYD